MSELNFLSTSKFSDVETSINDVLKKMDSANINYINIGEFPLPNTISKIKYFLQGLGVNEDEVINAMSSAIGMSTGTDFSPSNSRVIDVGLVVKDHGVYSTSPIWLRRAKDDGIEDIARNIGSITQSEISNLITDINTSIQFPNVIFRKMIQDIYLYSYNNSIESIVIGEAEGKYWITYSTDFYIDKKDDLFFNKAQFHEFNVFVKGLFSRKYSFTEDGGVVIIEIDNQKIFGEVILDGSSISVEIHTQKTFPTSFYNDQLPSFQTIRSGFNIISYEKKSTKRFVMDSLRKEHRDNILYLTDGEIGHNVFDFNSKMGDDVETKINLSKIIVIDLSSYENIIKVNKIIKKSRSVVMFLPSLSLSDTISDSFKFLDKDIAKRILNVLSFVPSMEVCPYCSKTATLINPVRISSNVEAQFLIPAGDMVVRRNHEGCEKCKNGVSGVKIFLDRISINESMVDMVTKEERSFGDITSVFADTFINGLEAKIDAVKNKVVDPIDICRY